MWSGGALTVTAIVPEYVQSARRLSPAMSRTRSGDEAPQRFIQPRIGNQYSIANVRTTKSEGSMAPSESGAQVELRHRARSRRDSIISSCLPQGLKHARIHHLILADA